MPCPGRCPKYSVQPKGRPEPAPQSQTDTIAVALAQFVTGDWGAYLVNDRISDCTCTMHTYGIPGQVEEGDACGGAEQDGHRSGTLGADGIMGQVEPTDGAACGDTALLSKDLVAP